MLVSAFPDQKWQIFATCSSLAARAAAIACRLRVSGERERRMQASERSHALIPSSSPSPLLLPLTAERVCGSGDAVSQGKTKRTLEEREKRARNEGGRRLSPSADVESKRSSPADVSPRTCLSRCCLPTWKQAISRSIIDCQAFPLLLTSLSLPCSLCSLMPRLLLLLD